ncbi:MAG: type-F conjugative transfer system pilin assembly protein TrbC [Burkholderiales bacterium]|nr:type-F conjugative transfer system pilin assembly protein TrbC [Burkholderiales bacterium]MDE2298500.1 type-F conjugative transfer system pilin assembly protein TrbC [Burkholderiales bacterium]
MSATELAFGWPRTALSVAAILGVSLASVWAAPTVAVTDADIERAKQSQPAITDQDIERARQRHRMPSDAELSRVPVPSTPRIEALPQPASRIPIDLGALARGFDAQAGQPALQAPSGPGLLVFISFAMPEATLARLVEQAARARASLVLRGLVDGSLTKTVTRVQGLIGSRQVSVQIDPQAFDRFSVTQTPTFVLVRDGALPQSCAAGMCFATDAYAMAAGDVSLDYVLAFFQRSAPKLARDAGVFAKRLKG